MKANISRSARKGWAWILAALMVVSVIIPTTISTAKAEVGTVQFNGTAEGWLESAYAEWAVDKEADGYTAYIKKASQSDSAYARIDNELIRKYKNYYRVDVVGLAAGDYVIKVVPVKNGKEVTAKAEVTDVLSVSSYDRSGFAFSSESRYKTGSGAYNEDGTLKSDAIVLYVTNDNAKTITAGIMEAKGEKQYTGLQTIIDAYTKSASKGVETRALDVRVIGCLTDAGMDKFSSSSEGVQIKGASAYSNLNMTLEGIGEDASISGFGFLLRNAGNVEMRNLSILNFMDDGISLDTANCNVWIHNVDLYYGKVGGDADQAKGDGTVDVKGKSTFVTVSYNHFFDSGKSSLCGMKGETTDCQITYHHNWFDHSDSRHPRIRTMSVHIYNNYFDGNAKYGVGTTMGSSAFVEANYFRNCKYPMLSSKQGTDATGDGTFSGENGGMIKAYNNHIEGAKAYLTQNNPNATTGYDAYEVTERSAQVPSSEVTKAGGTSYNNFDTDTSKFDLGVDTANIDAPEDVPAKVMAQAGRVNGGDFKWTFNNATEDTNYAVISELKSAVVNYKSSIVSFGGNSDGTVVTTGATTTTEATTETTTSSVNPTETTTEAQIEISTVDLTAKDGFSPSTATPAAGSISVEYQSATDDYLLKDTSDVAAATWTNSFEPITSGKVIVKGYATPVIAKAAGKWAFVQVKGTNKAGDSADIADLASDASKNIALRTGSSAYTSTSDTIASTKYNYEFVFDLDAQTVTLTVNGKTLTHSIDAQSISSVVGITANSAVNRNLIMSKPTVGVPAGGTTPTETTTAKTTDATTETTTAVVTEATTKVTDATTETTTETTTVTETSSETTTEAPAPEPSKNVKGDADGNGKVEANDAALVLQKVLTGAKVALEDVATNAFELLDADKDGQLTAKDAAYILQKALDSTFTMPNEK